MTSNDLVKNDFTVKGIFPYISEHMNGNIMDISYIHTLNSTRETSPAMDSRVASFRPAY